MADLMDSPHLIRNVALAGHLHHGKVRGERIGGEGEGEGEGIDGLFAVVHVLSLSTLFLSLSLSLSPTLSIPFPLPRLSQTSFLDNLVEQTHPGMASAEDKNVSQYKLLIIIN